MPNLKELLQAGDLTTDVPTAGRIMFGISRNASYDAAKRGQIPVIRVGGKLRVAVSSIRTAVESAAAKAMEAA